MKFVGLELEGLYAISVDTYTDERGKLQRVWDSLPELREFNLIQSSFVANPSVATLRGMHFQVGQGSENKLVQCVKGMVFDVVIDLRPDSKSLNKVVSVILGENSVYKGLIIPAGCAHGYLTLEPNSDFIYFMDKTYMPALSRGIRWNDPKYSIPWPLEPRLISDQDLNWPLL